MTRAIELNPFRIRAAQALRGALRWAWKASLEARRTYARFPASTFSAGLTLAGKIAGCGCDAANSTYCGGSKPECPCPCHHVAEGGGPVAPGAPR